MDLVDRLHHHSIACHTDEQFVNKILFFASHLTDVRVRAYMRPCVSVWSRAERQWHARMCACAIHFVRPVCCSMLEGQRSISAESWLHNRAVANE